MSETWADAQFDLLESAYNEIPIEAKARIEQLESSLDEVAEKWAIAQVNYEDCARRNTLLEALVRDMWFKNIGRMDSCGWCVIGCDDAERCELQERMAALGLLDGDAE